MKIIKSLFWDIPIWAVRALLFCIAATFFWVFRLLEWLLHRAIEELGGLLLKKYFGKGKYSWCTKTFINICVWVLVPIKALKNAFIYVTVWIVPLKDEVKR